MKKILSSTYVDYFSDPRAYKIDEDLSKSYDVVVLSPQTKEGKNIISNTKILYCKRNFNNVIVNLLYFWFLFIKEAISGNYNYVIAHNYYLTIPLYFIGLFTKSKTIYDSYELYVPTKNNPLSKRSYLFYLMEQATIRKFDLVLSANEERSRLMKAKFKLKTRPISLLNVTTKIINDVDIDILLKYPQIRTIITKTIFVYQGFLGAGRNCADFLKIIDRLGDGNALLVIGGGPELEILQKMSSTLSAKDRIVFVGNVPMSDVQPLLSLCDFGFVSYPFTDLNNKYCSPNKIYEYPAAGLPMISSRQTTIINILKKYNIACFVDYNNLDETISIINKFINNRYCFRDNIQRFLNENTWSQEFSKLYNMINKL